MKKYYYPEYNKQWEIDNPDSRKTREKNWMTKIKADPVRLKEHRRKNRNTWLKFSLNITLEEWEKLLESQDFKCAICSADNPGIGASGWHTDHDHETKIIRGILCRRCNMMLSKGVTPELLIKMAEYISK
jgi:hypothetical protein